MYSVIILGVIMLFLIIKGLLRYKPKFDLIVSNNKPILLLWYDKYDNNNEKKRVYQRLF